ncbi:MAG TPA: FAD binding domain-containing protein [Bryobacteraceae bacterium]|nr:FAD binding domain-containing protein [Bryobacteraceae bacterium]
MFESVEAFYRPATVRDALKLLHKGHGSARIVAGCTDVMLERDRPVRFLIDITRAGLTYIRKRGARWAIGATTTMSEIEASPELHGVAGGILAHAAAACGSIEIRNMATIGGNMANGSAAADLAAPLLALNADVTLASDRGRRKLPLSKYLPCVTAGHTRNSILVEVSFPDPPRGPYSGWSFQRLGRTALDISLVNVAAGLQLDGRGRVKWARIALGAAAPEALRMPEAEALLAGRTLDHILLAEATASVERSVNPITDVRATADYRREMSRVLTLRALEECGLHAERAL